MPFFGGPGSPGRPGGIRGVATFAPHHGYNEKKEKKTTPRRKKAQKAVALFFALAYSIDASNQPGPRAGTSAEKEGDKMLERVTVTEANIEEIKDQVRPIDMQEEITAGQTVSYSDNRDGSHVLVIHEGLEGRIGRGAICHGGDSVWGDWLESEGILRLDDGAGEYTMLGEDVGPITVEYSGGPGPYDTVVDYMLATVETVETDENIEWGDWIERGDWIKLYADADPVEGDETGTYEDLAVEILRQAVEAGIDVTRLVWHMHEPILTTADAAEVLGISIRRAQQLAQEGRLGRKVGRDYVISVADLERERVRPPAGRPRDAEDELALH